MKNKKIFKILVLIFFTIFMSLLIILTELVDMEKWVSIIVNILTLLFGAGIAVTFTLDISIKSNIKKSNKNKNELTVKENSNAENINLINQQGENIYNINDIKSIAKEINKFTENLLSKQKENTAEIVKLTFEQLKYEKEKVNVPNDDWLIKFYRYSQEITDSDFQRLWSNVLLSEMKNPKSIKIRALEELSRMSKDEILLFEKISKYAFSFGGLLAIPTSYAKELKFIELSLLTDIGLFKPEPFLSWKINMGKNDVKTIVNNKLVIIIKNEIEEKQEINIEIKGFTEIGTQIFKSIGFNSSNDEFIKFARYLKEKGAKLKISLHKINTIINDNINYQIEDLLLPPLN